MGPRPFSRGNSGIQYQRPSKVSRFNGATTFQPWKPARIIDNLTRRRLCLLQWGHDLSAVETKSPATQILTDFRK